MNKHLLIGHIGNDPEMLNLENGNKIAKFSLATNETYKNKGGEKVSETDWHNVVVFGKQAEIVEKYFKKGSKMLIEGRSKTRSWETEGVKKYATDVIMNSFEFLDSKATGQDNGQATGQAGKQFDPVNNLNDNSDDLPF